MAGASALRRAEEYWGVIASLEVDRPLGIVLPAAATDQAWNWKIEPSKVFDLTLPLEEVAEGYRAMDERRAIKTLLLP